MSEHVTKDATAKKRKPTRKARRYTFQLTTLLEPEVADALAIDAEIMSTTPSQHSRWLLTEGLVARGRLKHPALNKYPHLNGSK